MRIAFILISLSLVTIAFAEPTVPQRSGPYLGVQPGMRDVAPNTKIRGATKQDNALTWVGFDMTAPGGRVFLQTTSPVKYQVLPTNEDQVIIQLQDCELNWKNDGHHLDTSWFAASAVKTIQAKPKKNSNVVEVRIQLKKNGAYDLRQEGSYLFIDFVKAD